MTQRRLKIGYFVLEGINSFATSYYFNYLFFYTQRQFGYGNLDNLLLSAANGFVYMCAAWYGGRYGQKQGYFPALRLGFGLMAVSMLAGCAHASPGGHFAGMILWTLGMCFTWPNLEALASEDEPRERLIQMIGIYNLVWASGTAIAFFIGGALIESLGWQSMFWLPAGLHLSQLALLRWLRLKSAASHAASAQSSTASGPGEPTATTHGSVSATESKTFLRMAWLANPFAYIAINTAIPLIPGLARRFELTPTFAGFFCSAWMFARLATFLLLWRWPRWHYRFSWLAGSYLLLMLSFVALLQSAELWAVVAAQVVLGWSVGLIYYSSLFYSMDASDTKGVHGGVHESAIGFGIFAGPAAGAAALRLFPGQANASTWTVAAILVAGFLGLARLRQPRRRSLSPTKRNLGT